MTTPSPVVSAPEPRGLRYGLLVAATGPLELPDHAISSGVRYEPVSCGFARLYPIECPTDTPTHKVFDGDDELVDVETFVAYATLQCAPVGRSWDSMRTRVLRRLANGEQSIAEQALNEQILADPDLEPVGVGDPTSFTDTIASLEQWLYGQDGANYGNVGYLHAPVRMAEHAARTGLIVKDGPLMRTVLGTVWVFGGGYPDDGRIYATGNTTVWRSPDPIVPDLPQTFDRVTNVSYALAERPYAVAYDCVAGYAEYTGDVPVS